MGKAQLEVLDGWKPAGVRGSSEEERVDSM